MLASRQLQKGLEHVTKNRELSRKDFRELCDLRIEAGAKELHYDSFYMRDTLARLHVGLNTKILAPAGQLCIKNHLIKLCTSKPNS